MIDGKFILNFTPTGLIPTKEMTDKVPISPEEIVEDVLEAAQLGANMVHLHERKPDMSLLLIISTSYWEILRVPRQICFPLVS